jgi:glycerol-3-phosphate dehydrogenase
VNHPRPEGWRDSVGADAAIDCDVLVVGGGINGAGIARDLAGRGLKVVLARRTTWRSHTSSAVTKLIHGGLRYLEYYEFSWCARRWPSARCCCERAAHHVAAALRDAARPRHAPGVDDPRRPVPLRPPGAARGAAGSTAVRPAHAPAGAPLKPQFSKGFVYSDGWVDDARLVVLNASTRRRAAPPC